MNILEKAKEVHQNAKDHGWHDGNTEHDTVMALVVDECCEALTALRAGTEKEPCDKNIGLNQLEEEVADIYLRILDYIGYMKYTSMLRYEAPEIRRRIQFLLKGKSDGAMIGQLIKSIVINFQAGTCYDYLLAMVEEYAKIKKIDLENAVTVKHEYNKTRPFKHGGKKF